jgi:hypothetical protein
MVREGRKKGGVGEDEEEVEEVKIGNVREDWKK